METRAKEIDVQFGMVKDLADRGETAPMDKAKQLYQDGETQFLLENYDNAAAKFLDALDITEFKEDKAYPEAAYYLAESLFQLESYIDSKRYFKLAVQVLDPAKRVRRYQDSLLRLIRLSDLTGDLQGVDTYFDAARKVGGVRPELTYQYAKWMAARTDLPLRERDLKSATAFADIQPGQPFYAQALYFRAALLVELGYVDNSIPLFKALAIVKDDKKDSKIQLLRDLAELALGRIYVEQKKFKEALVAYHSLGTNSPHFTTSLYERALAYLQAGDFENALRSCDTLVLLGKDSAAAPQAALFQANLLLRMGATDPDAYEKASVAFSNVVQTYAPIRDQIRAIVERPDPVAFFDEMFKRDPSADFTSRLPRVAQGYMDASAQVTLAHTIQGQLAGSKKNLDDSTSLAKRMLDALATGGFHAFPQLQESNSRAIELTNKLVELEGDVLKEQIRLLGQDLPPEVRDRLVKLSTERAELDKLFLNLPKSAEQYNVRVAVFRKTVSDLELKLFQVRRQLENTNAILTALDRYWHDTLDEQKASAATRAEREKDFLQWRQLVDQLDARRAELAQKISLERIELGTQASGGKEEEDLRQRYHAQYTEMRSIIEAALPNIKPENRAALDRLETVRATIDTRQPQLAGIRTKLADKVAEKLENFRKKIVKYQSEVDDEQKGYGDTTKQSSQLIGLMAVEAFRKVERDFQGIVQRGDVGLVDVAWSKKQQRTHEIEKFAKQKEDEIQNLGDRFREVLGDAE